MDVGVTWKVLVWVTQEFGEEKSCHLVIGRTMRRREKLGALLWPCCRWNGCKTLLETVSNMWVWELFLLLQREMGKDGLLAVILEIAFWPRQLSYKRSCLWRRQTGGGWPGGKVGTAWAFLDIAEPWISQPWGHSTYNEIMFSIWFKPFCFDIFLYCKIQDKPYH